MRHLPKLDAAVKRLQRAAEHLPEVAALEMERAAQDGLRRGVDPYGQRLAQTEDGHKFDPQGHVAAGWKGEVIAGQAVLSGTHRACGWLGRKWKGRPARLQRPQEGEGIGTWLPRISKAVGTTLKGAARG